MIVFLASRLPGGSQGGHWTDNLPLGADILEHYQVVLNPYVQSNGKLEQITLAGEGAQQHYNERKSFFVEAFGLETFASVEPQAAAKVLADLAQDLQTCGVTRLTGLICQTLQRTGSSKTLKRLEGFTASLTHTAGQNWATVIHPELRVLIEEAMGST